MANAPIVKMDTEAQTPVMSLTFHCAPVASVTKVGPATGMRRRIFPAAEIP
jgi:hypothetical protein